MENVRNYPLTMIHYYVRYNVIIKNIDTKVPSFKLMFSLIFIDFKIQKYNIIIIVS